LSAEIYLCHAEKGDLVKNNLASTQVYIFRQDEGKSASGG
jgi:hypothetical protein